MLRSQIISTLFEIASRRGSSLTAPLYPTESFLRIYSSPCSRSELKWGAGRERKQLGSPLPSTRFRESSLRVFQTVTRSAYRFYTVDTYTDRASTRAPPGSTLSRSSSCQPTILDPVPSLALFVLLLRDNLVTSDTYTPLNPQELVYERAPNRSPNRPPPPSLQRKNLSVCTAFERERERENDPTSFPPNQLIPFQIARISD